MAVIGYVIEGYSTIEDIQKIKDHYRECIEKNKDNESFAAHIDSLQDYIDNTNEPHWVYYKSFRQYPAAKAEKAAMERQLKGKKFRVVKASIGNTADVMGTYTVIPW